MPPLILGLCFFNVLTVFQVGNEELAKDLYTNIQKTLDAMIDGSEDEKNEPEEKTDEPSKAEADKKDE